MFTVGAPTVPPKIEAGTKLDPAVIAAFTGLFDALTPLELGVALPVSFPAPVVPTEKNPAARPEVSRFQNRVKAVRERLGLDYQVTLRVIVDEATDVATVYVSKRAPKLEPVAE